PIGDKLLFKEFDYWLNIGGIVNMSLRKDDKMMAFDVTVGNQALNALALKKGKSYDENGGIAKEGRLLIDVLGQLNDKAYFKKEPPKSLSNEEARNLVFPALLRSPQNPEDLLRTVVQHIAEQITEAVRKFPI